MNLLFIQTSIAMKDLRLTKISSIAFVSMFFSAMSFAQTSNGYASQNQSLSPYFVILSDEGSGAELPLKTTNVTVNIAGVIADVNVKQVYTNTGKTTIEAVYVFPASTRAAVYDMVMSVNDRKIKAVVEEKSKARNMYETAKKAGKTASLLEQERPNVFKMNVGNIIPGATVEVNMSYTELLVPTDNTYEFVYPTVVGPRYVSQAEQNNTQQSTWTGNPFLKQDLPPISTLSLNVNLASSMPIKEMRCETHLCDISYTDKTTAHLINKEPLGGNRDFVMQYRLAGNAIESGVMVYNEPNGEQYFLAMMQPPKRIESQMITNREYVFIMDVSGSMYGFPLEISKDVMENLLKELTPNDRFNIVLFAGVSNTYSPQSLPVTKQNIDNAISFINNCNGGGGTELLEALHTAMNIKPLSDYSRSFVILTDGYVSVEKEAFDYIRQNLGSANFFSFGIGSSVNRFLIEGMAHVGYGEPFFALNQQDALTEAPRFIKYVTQPVLTDINYQFNNVSAYDLLPNKVPDLFASRPIIITGKLKSQTNVSITLTGNCGDKQFSETYTINSANNQSLKGIKYFWAREKIRLLSDYNNLSRDQATIDQIIKLSKTYNLMTEFTSFIAIDSVVSNTSGQSKTIVQPSALPQGVSNLAVGGEEVKSLQSVVATTTAIVSVDYDKGTDDVSVPMATENTVVEEVQEPFIIVEQMPEYQGGQAELMKYLSSNLQYPVTAQENGIQGTVYVRFEVDKDGKVHNVKILRGISPEIDKEAIRLVMAMPAWKPGRQGGRDVNVTYTLPIRFALQN